MMHDVMVQPAGKPTHHRVLGGVIGRGCEDVIHAVFKLVAVCRKVGGVDGVSGLEYQRHAQTDNQMNQKKRAGDQQTAICQHHTGRTSM